VVIIKRKVIQIANSTQLISLPRKWAQKYNIKKGDELELEEQGNKLTISTEERANKHSTVEVRVDGLDKDSLIFLLRGLYLRGYDEIKFSFADPYIFYHRLNKKVIISSVIHKEVAICQGLDIIQERKDFILMKNISESSIKELDTILRRIFLLLIDTANDLYTGVKKRDYALLETFQDKHDTITRLINYNLKTLNIIGYSNHKDTITLFNLISSLDMVIDIMKNAARDIIEARMKFGSKAIDLLGNIHEAIKMHYDLFYNFSFDKAEKFIKTRNDITDRIKKDTSYLSKNEISIIVMVEHTLEVLRDTYPSIIAMQY
jgi:phosphate uptake regulator